MELTRITLPPVTQECLNHRISQGQQCSSSFEDRVGDPRGACGEEAVPLRKVLASELIEFIYDESIPESMQSPAYEALSAFTVSAAEIGQLFDYWQENTDDPREAVCDWVVANFDKVERFVPRTYPRVIEEELDSSRPRGALPLSGFVLSCLAVVMVAITAIVTFQQRNRIVMRVAQFEFLTILLVGLMLVSIGSVLIAIPPSNFTCVASIWLTNIGYTLELVPLIVKMAAIQRIVSAARKLRHVHVNRRALVGLVVIVSATVAIFLTFWTAIDPPRKQAEFDLTTRVNESGATIVSTVFFCSSRSPGWRYSSVCWHGGMLIIATIQAFQTRNVRQEINESQTLAMLIYSHFMFVCLRVVLLLLESTLGGGEIPSVRSIIFSLDCIATVGIYFWPKFFADDEELAQSEHMIESQTVKQLRMLAAIATAQHERQINRRDRAEGAPSSPSRTAKRLSLPADDFTSHLQDVDATAYVQSMSRKGVIPLSDFADIEKDEIEIDTRSESSYSPNRSETEDVFSL